MVIISPEIDTLLGLLAGMAFYFFATGSWWQVPILLRRLREIL